jgi:hypothetical protein
MSYNKFLSLKQLLSSRCGFCEAIFVLLFLVATAILGGGKISDWTSTVAVFFTFLHGQVSFALQESHEKLAVPSVSYYRWSKRYFITKELFWIVTFILMQSWPLLSGALIFATYPYWRCTFRNWVGCALG